MADAEPQDVLMWMTSIENDDIPGDFDPFIVGESNDKDATLYAGNAFELTEFSVKGENSTNIGSSTGGGAGAGKVKFDRLTCKKFSDKATTQLLFHLANGSTFMDVYIMLRSNNKPYIEMTFKMCILSELEFSQSGEDQAEDSFVLDWGAMNVKYYEQTQQGNFNAIEPQANWSRVCNEPAFVIEA